MVVQAPAPAPIAPPGIDEDPQVQEAILKSIRDKEEDSQINEAILRSLHGAGHAVAVEEEEGRCEV